MVVDCVKFLAVQVVAAECRRVAVRQSVGAQALGQALQRTSAVGSVFDMQAAVS